MDFRGVIIEESLVDRLVLDDIRIVSTKVELVTKRHKTPWLKHWTLHVFEVPPEKATMVASRISQALDGNRHWYADYKNETEHYVIYKDKVFHITDRSDKKQYDEATRYGVATGIPEYQVDFSPHLKKWQR